MRTMEKGALPLEAIRSQVSHACFFLTPEFVRSTWDRMALAGETGTRLL